MKLCAFVNKFWPCLEVYWIGSVTKPSLIVIVTTWSSDNRCLTVFILSENSFVKPISVKTRTHEDVKEQQINSEWISICTISCISSVELLKLLKFHVG